MITVIAFALLLFLGLPIALTLMASTIIFINSGDLQVLLATMPVNFYGSLEKSGLLAIPLFMLVGEAMNRGGLTKRLMAAANVFVGGFRGGLAYVNLLTNAMAASILGSAVAQISVMSKIMIPEMEKRGYKKGFSAAVTTAGGLMGPIIPPSMLMIIYGVIAYQPVAALFVAGILPGLLMLLAFGVVIFLVGMFSDLPKSQWQPWRIAFPHLMSGLVPGIIPMVIIVGIVSGVMTPTESGAFASLIALILGVFVYREIRIKDIPEMLFSVAINTAIITSLIAAASTFGWVLSFEGAPDRLVEAILEIADTRLMFLLLVNVVVFILGMFIETISVLIIIVPILLPAVEKLGIDLIHFGVVVSLGTVIGLVTPPVGPGLYMAMIQANISLKELFIWVVPFLLALLVAMAIINIFPEISLVLPRLSGLI